MVFQSLIRFTAGKRIPSIKFRKGGYAASNSGGGPETSNQASASSTASATKQSTYRPVIEDWELPTRYARKQIDSYEMEYINRGGPE